MAFDRDGRSVTGSDLPKSFSIPMGSGTSVIELTTEEREEQDKLKTERQANQDRITKETKEHLQRVASQKVTRKLIPWGTRLLVKRRKVDASHTSSHIILPDEVKDLPTDIADVIEVPEHTMVDISLLRNAQTIIDQLSVKANQGEAASVEALFKLKEYLLVMTTKPGDVVLMARYGGTDFHIPETKQTLCVTDHNGIYCRIVEKHG